MRHGQERNLNLLLYRPYGALALIYGLPQGLRPGLLSIVPSGLGRLIPLF